MSPITPSKQSERRQHRRVFLGRSVLAHAEPGAPMTLEVMDYSFGGLGLVSHKPFAVGDILTFDTMETIDGANRPLGLKGEVCYVQEQFQEFAVGIRFL